jgi:hypothetical protein
MKLVPFLNFICDLPELKGVHRKKLYFEKNDIKGSDVRVYRFYLY